MALRLRKPLFGADAGVTLPGSNDSRERKPRVVATLDPDLQASGHSKPRSLNPQRLQVGIASEVRGHRGRSDIGCLAESFSDLAFERGEVELAAVGAGEQEAVR